MRWSAGDRGNIEDLRGHSGGGGGRMIPLGIGGFIVVALLSLFTGVDFFSMLGGGSPAPDSSAVGTSGSGPAKTTPAEERMVDMVDAVARDAQQTWTEELGSRYQPTRVVLFRDAIQSACGYAGAATGPFYCPGDRKVYLDLSFLRELDERFGAPGDFAQAYVVAHEVGHHIQTLTGLSDQVASARQQGGRGASNALSVRQELQADCYAGVWGHHAARDNLLEPGDAEEGLRAAAAIGDDRLQQQSEGRVAPESFTHGSSDQRMTWLRRGLDSGRIDACDTFQR
jgi:predicted metalloprotease